MPGSSPSRGNPRSRSSLGSSWHSGEDACCWSDRTVHLRVSRLDYSAAPRRNLASRTERGRRLYAALQHSSTTHRCTTGTARMGVQASWAQLRVRQTRTGVSASVASGLMNTHTDALVHARTTALTHASPGPGRSARGAGLRWRSLCLALCSATGPPLTPGAAPMRTSPRRSRRGGGGAQ